MALHSPDVLLRLFGRLVITPITRWVLYRKADANLQLAFGDELSEQRRREILTRMFRRIGHLFANTIAFVKRGEAWCEAHVEDTEGRRVMNDAEAKLPRGWVGVTGHLGNWELVAQWMGFYSRCGLGGIIVKRQTNPHVNAIIERARGRHGMPTLYRDESSMRIVRLLREGRCIGMAPDQDVPALAGMFVEFFGRPAYTPIGPARLALTAGVPIMVGYMIDDEDGKHTVVFNEPVFPDPTQPKAAEIERLTRAWSRQLEDAIRANPEQWLWFHDRWKTTPEKLAAKGRVQVPQATTPDAEPPGT